MYNFEERRKSCVKGEKCGTIKGKKETKMGRIDIILPDELEEKFRAEVAKQLGMRRGNLTSAIQEAIELWIQHRRQKRSTTAQKAWEKRKTRVKE